MSVNTSHAPDQGESGARPPASKKARAWSFSKRMRSVSDLHDDVTITDAHREIFKRLLSSGDSKVNQALDAWSEGDRIPVHNLINTGYISSERVPPSDDGAHLANSLEGTLQVTKGKRRGTSIGSFGDYLAPSGADSFLQDASADLSGIGLGMGLHQHGGADGSGTQRTDEPLQPLDSVLGQSLLSTWPHVRQQLMGLDKLPKADEVTAALQRRGLVPSTPAETSFLASAPQEEAGASPPSSAKDTAHNKAASTKLLGPHHLAQFASARKVSMSGPQAHPMKRPRGHSNPLSSHALGFGSFDFSNEPGMDIGAGGLGVGSFDMAHPPSGNTPLLPPGLDPTIPRSRLNSLGAMFPATAPYDFNQPSGLPADSGSMLPQASPPLGSFTPGMGALQNPMGIGPPRARVLSDLDIASGLHQGTSQGPIGSPGQAFGTGVPYQYRSRGNSFGMPMGGFDSLFPTAATANEHPDTSMHFGMETSFRDDARKMGAPPGLSASSDKGPARTSSRLREKATHKKPEDADDVMPSRSSLRSSAAMGLSSSTGIVDLWETEEHNDGGVAYPYEGQEGGEEGCIEISDLSGDIVEGDFPGVEGMHTDGHRKRLSALRQIAASRAAAAAKSRPPRQAALPSGAMNTRAFTNTLTKRAPYLDDDPSGTVPSPLLPNVSVRTIGGVEVPVVEKLPGHIGAYSVEERQKRLSRFMEKRAARIWHKNIKYEVRKSFADSRLRVKGRFVPKDHEQLLREFMMMI